jgi:tetraacyldisaccharide 4'-kinase
MGFEGLVRRRVARLLEEGAWTGRVASGLATVWGAGAARSIARPLTWRSGLRVIAVGGATLGGSGKTPLAVACARALASSGARVALVAHGYRARPGRARIVSADCDLDTVGDEALLAARELHEPEDGQDLRGRARVVVAPSRQAALDLAARDADVVVLDGVLQTAPRRASLSLLATDPLSPWGAGALPPMGDLRAPRAALLEACDLVVPLERVRAGALAYVESRGAYVSGHLVPWSHLATQRIGLFTALARPSRVRDLLARHDVRPVRELAAPDHGPLDLPRASFTREVDLWLASPKCALHLQRRGVPCAVLEHRVTLLPALLRALEDAARPHPASNPQP